MKETKTKTTKKINIDNHYLCILDYYATGEGRTIYVSVEAAKNKTAATKKFMRSFFSNDCKDTIDYFSQGLYIANMDNKKENGEALKMVKDGKYFGSAIESFLMSNPACLRNFRLELYWNAS